MGRTAMSLDGVATDVLLQEAEKRMRERAQLNRASAREAGREFALARSHIEDARSRFARGVEREKV